MNLVALVCAVVFACIGARSALADFSMRFSEELSAGLPRDESSGKLVVFPDRPRCRLTKKVHHNVFAPPRALAYDEHASILFVSALPA